MVIQLAASRGINTLNLIRDRPNRWALGCELLLVLLLLLRVLLLLLLHALLLPLLRVLLLLLHVLLTRVRVWGESRRG